MSDLIFVDTQGVLLLNGQSANVDLEYDEKTDMFIVTADCSSWAEDYREFVRQHYPKDDPEPTITDAEGDCRKISGEYCTLREVNQQLEECCNPGDWYEFTWEYTDGSPVE